MAEKLSQMEDVLPTSMSSQSKACLRLDKVTLKFLKTIHLDATIHLDYAQSTPREMEPQPMDGL